MKPITSQSTPSLGYEAQDDLAEIHYRHGPPSSLVAVNVLQTCVERGEYCRLRCASFGEVRVLASGRRELSRWQPEAMMWWQAFLALVT